MILPTKHISGEKALLGVGAELLSQLHRPSTVSSLWESIKDSTNVASFEQFILGLDLLYLLGAIDWQNDRLVRVTQ